MPTPSRIAAAAVYGGATFYLENRQTDYAANKMLEKYDKSESHPVSAPSLLKDGVALAAAAYQGAGAGVEVNDSLGLPNTRLRRRIQAAVYAGAVSLWASPALTETGEAGLDQLINHPVRSTTVALAGSVVGKFLIVDRVRSRIQRLHISHQA